MGELKEIAKFFNISTTESSFDKIKDAARIGMKLQRFIANIIVTLGSDGIVIIRKGSANDNFNKPLNVNLQVTARHYAIEEIKDVVNVSGAGDCFASGLIAGMLEEQPEAICVSIGFSSAKSALFSSAAVPQKIFERNHEAWQKSTPYKTL